MSDDKPSLTVIRGGGGQQKEAQTEPPRVMPKETYELLRGMDRYSLSAYMLSTYVAGYECGWKNAVKSMTEKER